MMYYEFSNEVLKKLEKYLNEGNNYKIEELLEEMPQLDIIFDNGNTILHYAATDGLPLTAAYLIKAGVDVNHANEIGQTPLHAAAVNSRYDVVKILIEAGCNVNAVDANGRSSLHQAVCSMVSDMFVETVDLLLKNGAFANVYDNEDKDPLLLTTTLRCSFIDSEINSYYFSIFLDEERWVVSHLKVLKVMEMLIKAGVDLNRRNMYGLTVFAVALNGSTCQIIPKHLMQMGATFDYQDPLIIRALDLDPQTKMPLEILRHTALFDAQNQEDVAKNFDFEKLDLYNKKIYTDCTNELKMMKSLQLYELVKVYNILVDKDIGPYARNEVVINEFEKLSQDMLKRFPSYAELIFDRFKDEKIKQDLIKTATQKLNYLFDKNDKVFPIIVTDIILRFLPLEDLRTLSSL